MDNPNYRRLYRSRDSHMIAGICGGLAEYFRVDPTIVRLIAVVLLFLGVGILFFVYVVMWVIVPLRPRNLIEQQDKKAE